MVINKSIVFIFLLIVIEKTYLQLQGLSNETLSMINVPEKQEYKKVENNSEEMSSDIKDLNSHKYKKDSTTIVAETDFPNNLHELGDNNKRRRETIVTYRRFSQKLNEIRKKYMSVRKPSNPGDNSDCLRDNRKRVRFAPTHCYDKDWGKWSFNEEFWPFMKEIFNDLRFTFDYVLYDEFSNKTKLECKLWYLIDYLKSVVKDVKNPSDIVKTVKGNNKHYCNALDVYALETEIQGVESEAFSIASQVIAMITRITVKLVKQVKSLIPSITSMFGGDVFGMGQESSSDE